MWLKTIASNLSFPVETVEWISQSTSRPVNILFTGKTGVGKWTLINCLVGNEVAKVGHGLHSETKEVRSYAVDVNSVHFTVWDSPGLQDGLDREKEYVADMKAKCSQYDLVVYCVNMTDKRITSDELKAIRIITRAFGENMWKNAVFVLSHANQLTATKKDPNRLENKLKLFKDAIPEVLMECGVSKKKWLNQFQ